MRFRRRPSPLLLLLLPSLAAAVSAAAQENIDSTLTAPAQPRDARLGPDAKPTPIPDINTKSKVEIGTKDAPVDGKDGKPHAGPWVGMEETIQKAPKKPPGSGTAADTESELLSGPADEDQKKFLGPDGQKIPAVNDGVMDDPHRAPPKEGTTGTEGGVSEKDKARKAHEGQTGEKLEKKPDSPKAAPPLPLSEQSKLKPDKEKGEKSEKTKPKDPDANDDGIDNLGGLKKPEDLADRPKDPHHPIPASADKDHLDISKPNTRPASDFPNTAPTDENDGIIQPLHSYFLSLTMILVSEIGDKTFLIAALMAMKHDRLVVFSAAFCALLIMTILSAVLGHAVPTLIPERFTHFLAAGLFLVFGVRMLREGLAMDPNEGVAAEMQEVEMELEEKEHLARRESRRRSSVSPYTLEMGLGGSRKPRSGSRIPSLPGSPDSSPDRSPSPPGSSLRSSLSGLNNLFGLLLSPAWVQTFVMTFLGEWGDRSQIATIAMAAGADYWWVTGGAVSGHAVCTGVAVIGGRAIAGKVSLRVVTLGGAVAFIIFGFIYGLEALYA